MNPQDAFLNTLHLPDSYTGMAPLLLQQGVFQALFEQLLPDETPLRTILAELDRKSCGEKGRLRGSLCITDSRLLFAGQVRGFLQKTAAPYSKAYPFAAIAAAEFDKPPRADFCELTLVTGAGARIRYTLLLEQVKDAAEFVWFLRKRLPAYE